MRFLARVIAELRALIQDSFSSGLTARKMRFGAYKRRDSGQSLKPSRDAHFWPLQRFVQLSHCSCRLGTARPLPIFPLLLPVCLAGCYPAPPKARGAPALLERGAQTQLPCVHRCQGRLRTEAASVCRGAETSGVLLPGSRAPIPALFSFLGSTRGTNPPAAL